MSLAKNNLKQQQTKHKNSIERPFKPKNKNIFESFLPFKKGKPTNQMRLPPHWVLTRLFSPRASSRPPASRVPCVTAPSASTSTSRRSVGRALCAGQCVWEVLLKEERWGRAGGEAGRFLFFVYRICLCIKCCK